MILVTNAAAYFPPLTTDFDQDALQASGHLPEGRDRSTGV